MTRPARGAVSLAAVDLGASSGRVILGRVSAGRLETEETHRFRNGAVRLPDGLYWDILGLYQDVLVGLRQAVRRAPDLVGVAVDSWAVDYGLLDGDGVLLGNPRHYRDDRSATVVERLHQAIDPGTLYARTGIQFLPFSTIYQLAADPDLTRTGLQALLIPDLLGYWLTGVKVAEATNASTTGLLDATTGDWSEPVIAAVGLPVSLLPGVVQPGHRLGPLTDAVRAELGGAQPVVVTTVGSHDTASAVVGVPAQSPSFAYISCGTWGLVGVELDRPVLTEASRLANFTNERGVDGTFRYLRNVMGLWVLSESMRTWALQGQDSALADLLAQAAALPVGGPRVDLDAPAFLPPGDMPARVRAACRATSQPEPADPAQVVRCILDSLAFAFAGAVEQAAQLSGTPVESVHIVGGGSQNDLLCQLVADRVGRPVVAGPVEATALGNLLVQARTHQVLTGDLWSLRATLREAVSLRTYQPRPQYAGVR